MYLSYSSTLLTPTCPLISILLRWIGRKNEHIYLWGNQRTTMVLVELRWLCLTLTICRFVFDKKRWSVPCSPVLVLLYCYTLCGTEHAGCWGVERAQSQVSLLLVAISVSLDKGPVSLPSCQESEISQSPASRLIGICIYYWFTLARWCVLKAQGMLSYF